MELAQESASKQVVESPQELHSTEAPPRWQSAAWLFLCMMLVGAGLYIVANYLRALAWALVFAVALWPFYEGVRRQTPPPFAKAVLPILFTALVGLAIFLLFATLRSKSAAYWAADINAFANEIGALTGTLIELSTPLLARVRKTLGWS